MINELRWILKTAKSRHIVFQFFRIKQIPWSNWFVQILHQLDVDLYVYNLDFLLIFRS